MAIPKNQVNLAVHMTPQLRETVRATAGKEGFSVRQFVIVALECATQNELDVTIADIIDRAQAQTKRGRYRTNNKNIASD